jgi:acetylglutamate kinase
MHIVGWQKVGVSERPARHDEETVISYKMCVSGKINKGPGKSPADNRRQGHRSVRRGRATSSKRGSSLPELGYVGETHGDQRQAHSGRSGYGLRPRRVHIGCDSEGHIYNVNADTAAARIAGELRRKA